MPLPLPGYQSMGQMIQNRLDQGLQNRLQQESLKNALIRNQYAEPMAEINLKQKQAENELYRPKIESEIANRLAQVNKMNFESQNPFIHLPGVAGQLGAMEYIKRNPGVISDPSAMDMIKRSLQNQQTSSFGAGAQEELFFQNLVAKDNPQLKTPEQVYEASNVLREGGRTLSDGTKLNPLSKASSASFDRITKGTTTAGALTPLLAANQADAEINAISEYAQKGLEPYGNTILNYSPEQVMDTFKSDEASQKKLGRFIAAQQLQYEIAQNEIKLASGQPGITSTQELMALGGQGINTSYPKLSYQARKEAQRYFLEALSKGLEARKKAGISPTKALKTEGEKKSTGGNLIAEAAAVTPEPKGNMVQPKFPKKQSGKTWVYNPETGRLE